MQQNIYIVYDATAYHGLRRTIRDCTLIMADSIDHAYHIFEEKYFEPDDDIGKFWDDHDMIEINKDEILHE